MIISGKTDIGRRRKENQDTWRAGRKGNAFAWAVVCDGMGGQRAGRLASCTAISSVEQQFSYTDLVTAENPGILLQHIVEKANEEVFHRAVEGGADTFGMGTTIAAVVLRNRDAFYAHVGDSRVYLFRKNTLVQLTRDHSRVQEMVESGQITEQQARFHPERNRITRALGVHQQVQVDVGSIPVEPGDEFLLCSDGLSGPLSSQEIAEILAHYPIYQQARSLVEEANQQGGPDNITAVVMQIAQEEKDG